MRALYISYNGMLEGLGSSQVLAYLRGLVQRDIAFDLLSYEVPESKEEEIDALRNLLRSQGIRWIPVRRTRSSKLGVKVRESALGVGKALASALVHRPDIIHGRSYIPTAVADAVASIVPGAKLVFDCRGMLGDEYVDANYWTPDRIEYRLVKRYEARAFRRAEGVVVLTDALRRWINERGWFGAKTHVEAIPCCVDLDVFRFRPDARNRIRAELGLSDRTTLIIYAGSLGSWYREDEMARFAGIVRRKKVRPQRDDNDEDVRFLLLTRSSPDEFVGMLQREGFPTEAIISRKARPDEMTEYLSAGDIGLSFIKSCFSKKGSSPTKVAEYLACGLPVVLNGDIGDQADLAADRDACIVLGSYGEDELTDAAVRALAMASAPLDLRVSVGRRVAAERFGLPLGVARYERLYRAITSKH